MGATVNKINVSSVELHTNGVMLADFDTSDNINFSYDWTGVAAGSYSLTAIAYGADDSGNSLSVTSAPVMINVGMPNVVLSPVTVCVGILPATNTIIGTLENSSGSPVTGSITFTVTGANPTNATITTSGSGVASFTYASTNAGRELITATAMLGGLPASSTIERDWAMPLSCGEYVFGMLTNASCTSSRSGYADYYSFSGQSNETVMITMSSGGFATYLNLWDTNCDLLAGNGNFDVTNSQVVYTLPAAGTYVIEATSDLAQQTGSYLLQFVCNPVTNSTGSAQIAVLQGGLVLSNYATIDFGATTVTNPISLALTITNAGTAPLALGPVSVAGDFMVSNWPTGSIPAGGSAIFTVQFNASTNEFQIGQLGFANSAPAGSPFILNLSAVANIPGSAPTVTLTAPTNYSIFPFGTNIVVTANATASGGYSISNVQFVATTGASQALIGIATNSPYTINWVNGNPGYYSLFAVATDNAGRIGFSTPPVNVEILPPNTNQAPVAGTVNVTVFANSFNDVILPLTNCYDANGNPMTIIGVQPSTLSPSHPVHGIPTIMNGGKAILYTPPPGQGYPIDGFSYEISDGRGGTSWGSVYVTAFAAAIPNVTLTASNYSVVAGISDPLTAYVTPSQYVTKVDFYLGEILLGEVTNGVNGYYTLPWIANYDACGCPFTATASDVFGQMGVSPSISINVTAPINGPNGTSIGPNAFLDSYADSNGNKALTNLVTIQDGIFNLYGRAYHPLGSNDIVWRVDLYSADGQTLVRSLTPGSLTNGYQGGTVGTAITPGILVSNCDLTTVQNGVYDLRLVVMGGLMITNADVQIILNSNLKIGQFGFSQQDLVIPVNGIPLTVTRTYNSLNPDKGDFGYGWTYSLADMDVALDETRDQVGGWPSDDDTAPEQPFSQRTGGGRDVTLTLPDGQRTTFYFATWNDSFGNNYPYYVAAPGVTATLTNIGNPYIVGIYEVGGGNPFWQGSDQNLPIDYYDIQGWILTTYDGTQYKILRPQTGDFEVYTAIPYEVVAYGQPYLAEIDERNGDVISINRDGNGGIINVTFTAAATGATRQCVFQRNSDNLITAISDPNGLNPDGSTNGYPAMKYEYDGYDNLINVERLVDRTAGNYLTNTFLYTNPNFPHYITSIVDPSGNGLVRNLYDDSGHLTGMINASGQTNLFVHDLSGHSETQYDASGQPTFFFYDSSGNVVETIDALGHTTAFAYDGNGYLTNSIDALGHATTYVNDPSGNVLSVTLPYPPGANPTAYTTSVTYDQYGNQTSLGLPTGGMITNIYDASGNPTMTMDESGNVISFSSYNASGLPATDGDQFGTNSYNYDASGNMIGFTNALGGVTTNGYDANGNLTALSDNHGNSTIGYDALNRQTTTDYGNGVSLNFGYQDEGDWSKVSGSTLGSMQRQTDNQGRTAGWTTANGASPGFAYDADGRVQFETNSIGVVVQSVYNAVGWLVAQTNVTTGGWAAYGYDAVGRKTSETNVYGQVTWFSYWPSGSLQALTNATGMYWLYSDAAGACSACGNSGMVTDAWGRVTESITSSHDLPLQKIRFAYAGATGTYAATNSVTYPTGLTTPNQNAADYPSSVTDEGGRTRHLGYTAVGQLAQATDLSGTVWWTNQYDPQSGGLTNVLSPTGESLSYVYDNLDNLARIRFGDGNYLTNYYNTANELSGVRLPSGVNLTNSYDFAGRLTNRTSTIGENASFTYSLNDAVTVMTDNTGSTTNWHDAAGRLCGISYPSGATVGYALDLISRITVITNKIAAGGVSYVTHYQYDAAGNITNVVDPFNGQTSLVYDQAGRRMQRILPNGIVTTWQYNWKDQVTNIVHKTSGGTVLASASYVRATGGEPLPCKFTREDGTYVALGLRHGVTADE